MSRARAFGSLIFVGHLACGPAAVIVEAGQWQQTDLVFSEDSCLVADRILAMEDQLVYQLSERELTFGHESLGSRPHYDDAQTDLWDALYSIDGADLRFVFPPITLHVDTWGEGLFMHDACAEQPGLEEVGGMAFGMVVNSREILISSTIQPACFRNGEEFRWCTVYLDSRLVPAGG